MESSKESLNLFEMGKYLKKVTWDKEDLEHAKKFIEKISFLSEEKFMTQDFKGLDEFEYFMANNNKILIPTIGQYSSGKSTLLNLLIGEEYLPTSDGVCTNKGVIIEYISDKNKAELYELKLKLGHKFFSFEKHRLITDDKSKIQEEIDKINKEHKNIKLEDSFLLLKVYIKFFELFKEEEKEKILLIDFPGLGVLKTKNFFSSDVIGPLINQSDSFLFFNPEVINSDENQKIIMNIVEKIKNRKVSFSYKNCLFILNKWDNHRDKSNNYNYTLIKAKSDLENIFKENHLEDIFPDIDIINCSAEDYKAFLKKKNLIINLKDYLEYLKKNFEEEFDDDEFDEFDEEKNKNKKFYEYILKDINDIKKDLNFLSNKNKYNKDEYCLILNNFLKNTDYKLTDILKNDIIESYLCILSNINNHKLMIESNKENLEKSIKSHMLLAISNLKNTIETKGINFISSINITINFILKKLNSPMRNEMKYSKIDESEKRKNEIEEMFEQFKGLIDIDVSNYLSKQENIIDNYIREANNIFINKRKQNKILSNKIILGEIENQILDNLKNEKKNFYDKTRKHFETFISEVQKKIKNIKYDLKVDENDFKQLYFETAEINANVVNNSKFYSVLRNITNFLRLESLSELILHKYILYDDQETIINKSKENFNLVKKQNKESLIDYYKVYNEKLLEFEYSVKNEVQKLIDLSYSDYTKFKNDSEKIINESINEFKEYIKNKYKDN